MPCTCEYPYPVGVWDGHHPNCAKETGVAEPLDAVPAAPADDAAAVERMAEGIQRECWGAVVDPSWSDYDEEGKNAYRALARAALAALRQAGGQR